MKALTLRFLQDIITQPSLRMTQIQDKASMTQKCTEGYASGDLMHYERNESFFYQEYVGSLLNASVLLSINEVELSIYRFLSSGVKNSKR